MHKADCSRLFRIAPHIWRRLWLRMQGAEIASGVRIESGVDVDTGERWGGRSGSVKIDTGAYLSRGVLLHCFGYGGHIQVGKNVFIGPYSVVYGHGGVEIGEDTLIAMHCSLVSANHDVSRRDEPVRARPDELLPIVIGRDVWIGAGATVLGGVTIGDGAVVAAGAVVSRDVAPYEIVAGVPARPVSVRA